MYLLGTSAFNWEYISGSPDIPYWKEGSLGLFIEFGAMYMYAIIAIVFIVIFNLFKKKYNILGYIVIVFTVLAPTVLIKSLFPIETYGIWTKIYQRELIPFAGLHKFLTAYYLRGSDPSMVDVSISVNYFMIIFYARFFFCPMAMSLGMNLLSQKKRKISPYIISFVICILSLAKPWFDGKSAGGDISILIVSALGVFLGSLLAEVISKHVKVFKKRKDVFEE